MRPGAKGTAAKGTAATSPAGRPTNPGLTSETSGRSASTGRLHGRAARASSAGSSNDSSAGRSGEARKTTPYGVVFRVVPWPMLRRILPCLALDGC
ncbi:hypothetical protein [Arthrobacter sp. NPDC093139]|uniref:hypothetical protein n=1 Tax=Arthrobacter sp. NPDC093139 TaxID=3363945 RepID=UPI0038055434